MENVLFLLQKTLGGLLMPLPVILLLLLWGLLFQLRRKTRWVGFLLILLATGLLFVASYPPLISPYVAALERAYPSYRPGPTPAAYVAVLGNGHSSDRQLPVTSEVDSTGVVRLTEGLRIYRLNPGSKLIFTGYRAGDPAAYPEKMKELALALGVPEGDILVFSGPKDTAEEAQLLAKQFAGSSLVLVTSAAHMPRSIALFRQVGLDPIAAPTNHLAKPERNRWVFPDGKTLCRTQTWWYEQLGLVWARLMGQIRNTEG